MQVHSIAKSTETRQKRFVPTRRPVSYIFYRDFFSPEVPGNCFNGVPLKILYGPVVTTPSGPKNIFLHLKQAMSSANGYMKNK